MPISLPLARTLVFEHLQTFVNHPQPVDIGLTTIDHGVRVRAEAQHVAVDWNGAGNHLQGMDGVNVRAAVEELIGAGVLVRGYSSQQPNPGIVQPTEFGLSCLQAGAINPYDPDGYLASINAAVPNLDAVAESYLEEGLDCLRRQCHKAAAVMLGGASEAVMLALISAFHDALQNPNQRQQFERHAIKEWQIKKRVDYFRGRLAALPPQFLPHALREDLDIKLDGIFALLRAARNDAGHPNLNPSTRETVHGNYLLFPSYCTRAYGLIAHFGQNPIP